MMVFVLALILAWFGSANAATVSVPRGSNLQTFILAANCGDTLVLEAGATYTGTFVLVAPGGTCTGGDSDYVTVTTSGSLPPAGVRLDPSKYSAGMAKLVSPNTMPTLSTRTGANHWKFIGIDISGTEGAFVPILINLGQSPVTGDTPGWAQRLLMKGFVFDRCFIHPPEISATNLSSNSVTRFVERGIALNITDGWVQNSYIAGFTGNYPNGGIEASEDVLMDVGPGPLHVINNYLEAWYSNVFIGGADAPPLPEHTATVSGAGTIGTATLSTVLDLAVGDLVAFKLSDPPAGQTQPIWGVGRVTSIQGNTISYTPLTALYQSFNRAPISPGEARWRGEVLHDVEIKGNTMVKRPEWSTWPMSGPKNWIEIKAGRRVTIEGNLMTSGTPTNIALTVRNQNGSSPWIEISGLTFRSNKLVNFKDPGFGIALEDNEKVSGQSGNLVIENNLMIGPVDSRAFLTNGGHDLVFSHNTIRNSWSPGGGASLPTKNLTLIDNIFNNGLYGLGCFYGDNEWSTCWPGYNISTNVIIDNQSVGGLLSIYPGNFVAANQAAVQFVDAAGGNFRLASTSPYKSMASDGTDPGINQDALEAALAGTAATMLSSTNATSGGTIANSTPVTVGSAPTVSLGASPTTIATGQSASLSWSSSNATSCSASGAWSGSIATSGVRSVTPSQSSSYAITCTGAGGSASSSVTVSVTGTAPTPTPPVPTPTPPVPTPTPPVPTPTLPAPMPTPPAGTQPAPTASLGASPTTISKGQSTRLAWSASNATSCLKSGDWSGSAATWGVQYIYPDRTSTYSITCTGAGGSASRSVTVSVTGGAPAPTPTPPAPTPTRPAPTPTAPAPTPIPPAPTISLGANPTTIATGQSASLSWSSSNATSCSASGAWSGSMGTSGVRSVTPPQTSSYAITCTGAGGSASRSVTVSVTAPVPTVSLTASPTSISAGQSSLVSWSTSNASGCVASGGWSGTMPTAGSASVAPGSTTSYTLSCTGAGGTATKSVSVSVAMPSNGNGYSGWGSSTPGGYGQPVYHVTNLADSGSGSFRDAVSQGNRYVVFDVAGTINLSSVVEIRGAFVTVNGLSAPSPGITIQQAGLRIAGSPHDVIVSGIRIRSPGINSSEGDGITIKDGVYNVVIDHVSVNGASDGNIDITKSAHDVTVQWSVLSNCGANMLINYGAQHISLHHNIWVDSQWRNPGIQFDDAATTMAPDTTADFRNNIVWNWGDSGGGTVLQCGAKVNVVNNFYFSGATIASRKQNGIVNDGCSGGTAQPSFYTAGNFSADNLPLTSGNVGSAFTAAPVNTQSACVAAHDALAGAGALPWDAVDQQHLGRISLPTCSVP